MDTRIVRSLPFHDGQGHALVDMPIGGLRVGVRQSLPGNLRLGRYLLRLTEVELSARPALALHRVLRVADSHVSVTLVGLHVPRTESGVRRETGHQR